MMASNLATNSSSSTASTPTGKVCSASIGPVATLDAQENGCSPTDQRSRSPSPSEGKAGSNGIANGAALMENCSSSKNSQTPMSAAKPKLRVLQRDPSVTSSSSVTTATTTTAAMRRPQVAASATSEPVTKVLRQPRQANATNGFEARSDSVPLVQAPMQDSANPALNVSEFITDLLSQPKDRLFMLQVEQQILTLLGSPDHRTTSLRLPTSSSYHRMLVHRVAVYFGMDHNTDPGEESVTVHWTAKTRIPDKNFDTIIKSAPPCNGNSSAGETCIGDALSAPSPRIILKRSDTTGSNNNSGSSTPTSMSAGGMPGGGNGEEKKAKTMEEREAEYEEKKKRIFSQHPPVATAGDTSTTTTTDASVTITPSTTSLDTDDDYDRSLPLPPSTATTYSIAAGGSGGGGGGRRGGRGASRQDSQPSSAAAVSRSSSIPNADSGSWRTAGLGVLQSDTPNGGSGAATSQRTGHNVDSVSRRLERMAVDSSSSSGNHHRHHNHHSQRQQQQRRGHVADYQQHGQPAYLLPTPGANPRAPAMNTAGVRTRGFSSSPYVTNTGGYRNMPPQQQQQQQSLASFVNMMPAMGLYVSPSSSSSSLLGQPPMSSMPSHTGVAGPSGAFPNVQQQQQQGMHFSAAGAMNAASNASHPSYSRQDHGSRRHRHGQQVTNDARSSSSSGNRRGSNNIAVNPPLPATFYQAPTPAGMSALAAPFVPLQQQPVGDFASPAAIGMNAGQLFAAQDGLPSAHATVGMLPTMAMSNGMMRNAPLHLQQAMLQQQQQQQQQQQSQHQPQHPQQHQQPPHPQQQQQPPHQQQQQASAAMQAGVAGAAGNTLAYPGMVAYQPRYGFLDFAAYEVYDIQQQMMDLGEDIRQRGGQLHAVDETFFAVFSQDLGRKACSALQGSRTPPYKLRCATGQKMQVLLQRLATQAQLANAAMVAASGQ